MLRAALFAALLGFVTPAAAQDYTRQVLAMNELQSMCSEDRSQLWGADLCGPLLVVDPATRAAWASRTDFQGQLTPGGGGWTGVLPQGVPIANSSVEWAGVRWIMVVGPLPEDAVERRVLLAHEAWHRIQPTIGLTQQDSERNHLETERGRYLLRLEMRALATAMLSNGAARRRAARDALGFRRARLAEFPQGHAGEAALDRNEGLAAYTGVRLGASENAAMFAARTLDQYDRHDALARAYAYATGPAYGLLLDDEEPHWRSRLAAYAPADVLAIALRLAEANARDIRRTAERYGGPAIAAEERQRAETQRVRLAEIRALYSEGPRVELPLAQMQFEFDPNQVTPVEGLGGLYQVLTLRDVWGELQAREGALIDATFTRLIAARPSSGGLTGPGWRLNLAPGYSISAPDAAGVMRLEMVPQPPPDAPAE